MLSSRVSLSEAAEMPFDDLWRVAAPAPMPSPATLLRGSSSGHDESAVFHGLGPSGFFMNNIPAGGAHNPFRMLPIPMRTFPGMGPPVSRAPAPAPTPSPGMGPDSGGVPPEAKAPRRVLKSAVARLAQRRATEADAAQVCNICMDHFARGTRLTALPCEHAFCSDCIAPWLARHATCPVCRWEFPEEHTAPAPPQLSV